MNNKRNRLNKKKKINILKQKNNMKNNQFNINYNQLK